MTITKSKTATVLVQDVPEEIHSEFKAACARHKTSMRKVHIALMEGYIKGKIKVDATKSA